MLEGYPEQCIANYLLFGIREGFRVGFNRSSPLRSAKSNMKSAAEHPEVVSRYLSEEVKEGRVLGPSPRRTRRLRPGILASSV